MNIIKMPIDRWIGHDPEVKFNERSENIDFIVLHTTGGTDSRVWLAKWNRINPNSAQNQVSIHYLVQRDGNIYQIVEEDKRAWHVGRSLMPNGSTDGNACSIGVEIEHLNEPNYTEEQLNATAELVHHLMQKYTIDGKNVVSHASVAIPKGRKIDPVNFDWGDFWNRVLRHEAPANVPVTQPLLYTANSPLLNVPIIDADALIKHVSTKKRNFAEYTQADVKLISSYYLKYGKQTGIDWILALTQSIHETGWFASWWAARPRRNPAGIGVTGQTKTTRPPDADQNWFLDRRTNIWRRGQQYANWDLSVQHHISRLLCYALKDEEMTPEQLAFADISGARSLARVRGVAPKLVGLNGVWAVPGHTYAQKLAEIANSLVSAIN